MRERELAVVIFRRKDDRHNTSVHTPQTACCSVSLQFGNRVSRWLFNQKHYKNISSIQSTNVLLVKTEKIVGYKLSFFLKSWFCFHLTGALMEHFLEGIALLWHWYINPNEKSNKYKSSLLSLLAYQSLNKALPKCSIIRHLLNAKPQFMSWWRSAFNEVNDWALDSLKQKKKLLHWFSIITKLQDFF